VWGVGFGIWGLGSGVWGWGVGLGAGVWGVGRGVQGVGFRNKEKLRPPSDVKSFQSSGFRM